MLLSKTKEKTQIQSSLIAISEDKRAKERCCHHRFMRTGLLRALTCSGAGYAIYIPFRQATTVRGEGGIFPKNVKIRLKKRQKM